MIFEAQDCKQLNINFILQSKIKLYTTTIHNIFYVPGKLRLLIVFMNSLKMSLPIYFKVKKLRLMM
jgi:hypothetical protein